MTSWFSVDPTDFLQAWGMMYQSGTRFERQVLE